MSNDNDLSHHTPMVQQYRRVTLRALQDLEFRSEMARPVPL